MTFPNFSQCVYSLLCVFMDISVSLPLWAAGDLLKISLNVCLHKWGWGKALSLNVLVAAAVGSHCWQEAQHQG